MPGETVIVLLAGESFFLRRTDDPAIVNQAGGRIVIKCRNTQNPGIYERPPSGLLVVVVYAVIGTKDFYVILFRGITRFALFD